MERARVSRTLSQDVLEQLRSDILNGRLEPGARLKMAELTADLSVSLSVVREALNRLVEQELVVLEPQVGFRVKPLSVLDLVDLTEARSLIEGAACEQSVIHGDHQWEAGLLAAHHVLSKTDQLVDDGDRKVANEDWIAAHRAFHEALVAGCRSARLRAITAQLRDSAEIYRHWAGPVGLERHRDVAAEHRAILEAALARDVRSTRTLLCEHLERTTQLLLDSRR